MTLDSSLQLPCVACAALSWLSERPQHPWSTTTLRRVQNPSAPSSEEVWQQLRQHRAEIPAHLEAQRTRSSLVSLEPPTQVEQHEPLSRDMSAQDSGIVVIPMTSIHLVVLMFPEMQIAGEWRISETGRFSLMRHAFLELTQFTDSELFKDNDSVADDNTM